MDLTTLICIGLGMSRTDPNISKLGEFEYGGKGELYQWQWRPGWGKIERVLVRNTEPMHRLPRGSSRKRAGL